MKASQSGIRFGAFQKKIVNWFSIVARDLPWRKTSDPYRIWISEIMLQQTQVATVIPYYERFLARFPSVAMLAEASEEEVLKYWEGLGYYRRGKNLRLGAQLIVEKFGGKFPDTRDELLSVPGIGPYSAGAILSIAFRKSAGALDGNLIRVYSRLYAIQDFVDEGKTLKKLWEIATSHAPKNGKIAREFTEGMIELGALICAPKNPKCQACPVIKDCRAYANDLVDVLPRKNPARAREKYFETVSLIRKGSRLAFLPKGSDPKFPDFLRLPFETVKKIPTFSVDVKKFKYSVTHRDFQVFLIPGSSKLKKKIIWLDQSQIEAALLPAIDRKIIEACL